MDVSNNNEEFLDEESANTPLPPPPNMDIFKDYVTGAPKDASQQDHAGSVPPEAEVEPTELMATANEEEFEDAQFVAEEEFITPTPEQADLTAEELAVTPFAPSPFEAGPPNLDEDEDAHSSFTPRSYTSSYQEAIRSREKVVATKQVEPMKRRSIIWPVLVLVFALLAVGAGVYANQQNKKVDEQTQKRQNAEKDLAQQQNNLTSSQADLKDLGDKNQALEDENRTLTDNSATQKTQVKTLTVERNTLKKQTATLQKQVTASQAQVTKSAALTAVLSQCKTNQAQIVTQLQAGQDVNNSSQLLQPCQEADRLQAAPVTVP